MWIYVEVNFELDPSRININRTALLVLNEPIETIIPINIENTLPLSYIYNGNIPRRCHHVRMIEEIYTDAGCYGSISNSTTFARKLSLEMIITNSTNLNKLYNLSKFTNFAGVTEKKNYVISNDSQVFFTRNKFRNYKDVCIIY